MLVTDPELPRGLLAGLAHAVPDLPLLDLVSRAQADDLDLDLQVRRDRDGSFVLVVHVLRGMLVVDEREVHLGKVRADPSVLWLWASCLHADAKRLRLKVSAAIRSGRS